MLPADCPASTSTSPRVVLPSPYCAHRLADSTLTGQTRPATPSSDAQPFDRGQEIAAVALHHREQQVAAGVTAEARMLERRQPREQHPARFALVARHRQRAAQHVARRQHAELVAQLTRAAAAVEHRDDGVQRQPGIGLESAEQAGQTGAAPETADIEPAQLHSHPLHRRERELSIESAGPRSVVRGPAGRGLEAAEPAGMPASFGPRVERPASLADRGPADYGVAKPS